MREAGMREAGDYSLLRYMTPLAALCERFWHSDSPQKGELEESSRRYECVVWRGEDINAPFRLYTHRQMIPLHQMASYSPGSTYSHQGPSHNHSLPFKGLDPKYHHLGGAWWQPLTGCH